MPIETPAQSPDPRLAALEAENARLRGQLAEEEGRRRLLDLLGAGFCTIELRFEGDTPVDYRYLSVNPAFERETGLKDATGRWMRDLVPGHEQHWFDLYGAVARSGEPARAEKPADAMGRSYEVRASRLGQPGENKVAVLFTEITGRITAERAQAALNHELSHRLKNNLAMVQAIARQSLRKLGPSEEVEAFLDRLRALAGATDVLLRHRWAGGELHEVVAQVAGLLNQQGRVKAEGPSLMILPRVIFSLFLLLHELLTNAARYGALSSPEGEVRLSWEVDGPLLRMVWREHRGPLVPPAPSQGFGTMLIRMGLTGTGGVDIRYLPQGLEVELSAPWADVKAEAA
ncbi:sensor histidine kinase [Acetobacteraceae bacterium H6797]|nr:sensor histidine kinase [Acetobacteraceae bacterium H6797]